MEAPTLASPFGAQPQIALMTQIPRTENRDAYGTQQSHLWNQRFSRFGLI